MGFIKEPAEVDLVVDNRPVTDKDRKEISEFIRKSKAKNQVKPISTAKTVKK